MKSELKAKFLNHLVSKKREGGFTLIELLVVIIIIGILSAIALPSFLNQANKGRQSEARTYVGTLTRTQQSYFAEEGKFATALTELSNPVPSLTENYKYTVTPGGSGTSVNVTMFGTPVSGITGLKAYAGMVAQTVTTGTGQATSTAVVCETKLPVAGGTVAPTPTAPTAPGDQPTCSGESAPL